MSTSPDGIYEPGIVDPGFPVTNSTKPFWLSQPLEISKLHLTCSLYACRPGAKIVVIKARDLCSGATGRNSGHCKVMSLGEALKVMHFKHIYLEEMGKCTRENNIKCNLRLHEGVDVYHDNHTFGRAVRALEDMRRHAPDLGVRYIVYTLQADLNARHCPKESVKAIGMPSRSAWPYKFVTGLFKNIEESNNFTTMHITRGAIKLPIVIHTTNAWISHLVPKLRLFMSPVRANVQRHLPPKSKSITINNSLWLCYAEHDYNYMTETQGATIKITHAWSGCVAFTQDGNPFVRKWPGPGRKHQWVCGAYQGIRMVRAFRSAQALASMILGEDSNGSSSFPQSMIVTRERLGRLEGVVNMAKL
ncbi:uncharacterized protein BDV14DRAFT_193147 [Aspergillus stella-maris]|uniref:uncharacterized protein n=1 Tax=Aspergillus stella-maris TaxID=1810926 RepID=UPI003CCDB16F